MSKDDNALFVQGLIYGIFKTEYNGLEKCLSDSSDELSDDLASSVQHLKKENFDNNFDALITFG
jgi:hypothetical protein